MKISKGTTMNPVTVYHVTLSEADAKKLNYIATWITWQERYPDFSIAAKDIILSLIVDLPDYLGSKE